jgi:phosphoglucosamine mutase
MRQLFGTDGMRGVAGCAPLDPATLQALGRALVLQLKGSSTSNRAPRIALGQDTRESCGWIAGCVAAGIALEGGTVTSAGVIPTPGLALITRRGEYDAGLMVSASHNPYQDNGVKVFDAAGSKLSDAIEIELEQRILTLLPGPKIDAATAEARIEVDPALHAQYLAFLDECLERCSLTGLKVVLDAAHGAAYQIAEEAFRRAGAETICTGNQPSGVNINDGCGSLHPERMTELVVQHRADLGFSFDGDADRCMAASRRGQTLDGDFILYYAGRALRRAGQLPGNALVATVMSNLGLQKALERESITMHRAPVGDRYVLEQLRQHNLVLGGEQSGHVIFMQYAPTGDGVLTALTVARLFKQGAGDLDEALAAIPHFPQVLKNLRVRHKPPIESHPVLAEAIREAERQMAGNGRVVVRYSGTEPKARVMIEGADQQLVHQLADQLIEIFRRQIGE